ncbi:MAG TPA: PilZ domain-containing protein [Acidobacteriaceae bacterium]|jgi:hypothetical protein|nr:PilZ domain-containing protein [Acidobacteriaceae bacterium]
MDTEVTEPASRPTELRAAVRFPLRIPISVLTHLGQMDAMTVNISANGILFEVEKPVEVSSSVSFTIQMPAEAMGTPGDVMVNCSGRVVRCKPEQKLWQVAALIDKYYFSH